MYNTNTNLMIIYIVTVCGLEHAERHAPCLRGLRELAVVHKPGTYIYIYIHMYTYTHTYTYILFREFRRRR